MQPHDSDDARSPDGGQEVSSSYGKDKEMSVLHQFRNHYTRKIYAENHSVFWRLPVGTWTTDLRCYKVLGHLKMLVFLDPYWIKWQLCAAVCLDMETLVKGIIKLNVAFVVNEK